MSYILAIDQGTSSTRAFLFDSNGSIVSKAQKEIQVIYPHPGWVEQDPVEIWNSVEETCRKCIAYSGIDDTDISAIGISNQRETTIVWNRDTGQPAYKAIVWQSRQSSAYIDQIFHDGFDEVIRNKTGLQTDAYFSASKISWILDQNPENRLMAEKGELLFGTVDSWLLWKLCGIHATDISNASRTMLYNINKHCWDTELLNYFRVPEKILPEVRPSSGLFAHTKAGLFKKTIPVTGIAGDQQAALFGQACFMTGDAKNTYGTGCFMLMNTGKNPAKPQNGMLSTIAWQIGDEITYALEGSVFTAGAALKWLRDNLGLFNSNDEIQDLALSVTDNGGVYFVPAFSGLGAPWWDSAAKASFLGMSGGTNKGHFVRAALESMAFQTRDVFDVMQSVSGINLQTLRVDGGASASDLMMQFQSDLIGVEVERPLNRETTVTGAAMLAGIAAGVWKNKEEAASLRQVEKKFRPIAQADTINQLYLRWINAVSVTRKFK